MLRRPLAAEGCAQLQSKEGKLRTIGRAFSPPISQLRPETQADGLGWYIGAPLALSSAGTLRRFRPESQSRWESGQFMRLPRRRTKMP
jgi:hypothetical protein